MNHEDEGRGVKKRISWTFYQGDVESYIKRRRSESVG